MTVTKVRVTRNIKAKDGSWGFQVEADIPEYDIESGKGKVIRNPHDFLKDIAELQDKLHHFIHEGKIAEYMEHSKTEG
jgi:hypothetical protein